MLMIIARCENMIIVWNLQFGVDIKTPVKCLNWTRLLKRGLDDVVFVHEEAMMGFSRS